MHHVVIFFPYKITIDNIGIVLASAACLPAIAWQLYLNLFAQIFDCTGRSKYRTTYSQNLLLKTARNCHNQTDFLQAAFATQPVRILFFNKCFSSL